MMTKKKKKKKRKTLIERLVHGGRLFEDLLLAVQDDVEVEGTRNILLGKRFLGKPAVEDGELLLGS